jgi:hypothetical protein
MALEEFQKADACQSYMESNSFQGAANFNELFQGREHQNPAKCSIKE